MALRFVGDVEMQGFDSGAKESRVSILAEGPSDGHGRYDGRSSHVDSAAAGETTTGMESAVGDSDVPPPRSLDPADVLYRQRRLAKIQQRHRSRRILRVVFFIATAIVLAGVPPVLWYLVKPSPVGAVRFTAGMFVVITLPISFYSIARHLEKYYQPDLQKYVIRILWMVPIYSIDSWLSLRFKDISIYFDTARDCYEAWVMYSFLYFLINYVRICAREIYDLEDETAWAAKTHMHHVWPMGLCFKPWESKNLVVNCRYGVMVYVVIKPICTLITLATYLTNTYGGVNLFDPNTAYPYLTFVTSSSQFYALYVLVVFYHAVAEDKLVADRVKPLPKFICVKGVIFFSFWQSMCIQFLVTVHVITESSNFASYSATELGSSIQDFLMCIEMFIAAAAHAYSFPHKEWDDPSRALEERTGASNLWVNLQNMFDVSDAVQDFTSAAKTGGSFLIPKSRSASEANLVELSSVGGAAGNSAGGSQSRETENPKLAQIPEAPTHADRMRPMLPTLPTVGEAGPEGQRERHDFDGIPLVVAAAAKFAGGSAAYNSRKYGERLSVGELVEDHPSDPDSPAERAAIEVTPGATPLPIIVPPAHTSPEPHASTEGPI